MNNRILTAYVTSLLGIVSGFVTNLWLLREVTHNVDPSMFGVYALVVQITSYLAILQLSLDFAASRQIAESLGRNDLLRARDTYWELGRFNRYGSWITGLLAVVCAAVLLSGVGLKSTETARLVAVITLLAGGAQAVAFLSRSYTAALIGSQCQATVNTITVLRTLSTSILAYILLRLGLGVLCIPIAEVTCVALSLLVLSRQATIHCQWRTSPPGTRNEAAFKEIARFGWLTTLGGAAWTIESTADVMILGAFGGPTVVAEYVLWWRLPSMIFSVCSRLVDSSFPGFAERHGHSADGARQLLDKVGQFTVGLATVALVGIALWLPDFMRFWVGAAYVLRDGRLVALVMAALVALRAVGNLLGMFWLSSGNARVPTVLAVVQAVLKVGLGVALVQPLGILGIVFASCIASTVQVSTLGIFLYRRHLLPGRLIRAATVLTPVAVLAAGLGRFLPGPGSLLEFIFGVVTTAVLWGVLWGSVTWQTTVQPTLARLPRLSVG